MFYIVSDEVYAFIMHTYQHPIELWWLHDALSTVDVLDQARSSVFIQYQECSVRADTLDQ